MLVARDLTNHSLPLGPVLEVLHFGAVGEDGESLVAVLDEVVCAVMGWLGLTLRLGTRWSDRPVRANAIVNFRIIGLFRLR